MNRRRSADLSAALANYKSANHHNIDKAFHRGATSGYINENTTAFVGDDDEQRVQVPNGSATYFGAKMEMERKQRHSLFLKTRVGKAVHPTYAQTDTQQESAKLHSGWYVLNPRHSFFDSWATCMMCTLLWIAMCVPFRVSFMWEDGWMGVAAEYVVDSILFADFLIGCGAAYEQNIGMIMELVTNPSQIMSHYLRGYFFVDLLACMPLFVPISTTLGRGGKNHYHLARMLKVIVKLPSMVEAKMTTWSNSIWCFKKLLGEISMNTRDGMARIAKICMAVMLLTHWVSCAWHGIPTSNGERCTEGGDRDWIVKADLCDASKMQMYITSTYWAFTTLSTVGFGDIVAETDGEKMFCMLVMLLGVSCYAYILGSVSVVISHFDASERHDQQRHRQLAKFCNDFKVPMEIRRRLTHNLDFKLTAQQESRDYDIAAVLHDFSPSLRVELIAFIHRPLIEKLPYLHNKSLEFVAGVVTQLQTLVVYEGDTVVVEGKIATAMYFVGNGTLILQEGPREIGHLHVGDMFGEVGCLLGVVTASCRALRTCELYPLRCTTVLDLMAEFPAFELEMKEKALKHVQSQAEQQIGQGVASKSALDNIFATARAKWAGHAWLRITKQRNERNRAASSSASKKESSEAEDEGRDEETEEAQHGAGVEMLAAIREAAGEVAGAAEGRFKADSFKTVSSKTATKEKEVKGRDVKERELKGPRRSDSIKKIVLRPLGSSSLSTQHGADREGELRNVIVPKGNSTSHSQAGPGEPMRLDALQGFMAEMKQDQQAMFAQMSASMLQQTEMATNMSALAAKIETLSADAVIDADI
jgi:CRP-like cAMP-binding protein